MALRNLTRRSLYDLLHATGIHRVLRHGHYYLGAVLCFHRVYEGPCDYSSRRIRRLHVSRDFLEWLIRYYRDGGYDFVSLDRVHRILTGCEEPRPFIAVTFDDGYKDNAEIALPLFEKHEVPFCVYFSSGNFAGTNISWPFMLDDLMSRNDRVAFRSGGTSHAFDLRDVVRKERAYRTLEKMINECAYDRRDALLHDIFSPHGFDIASYSRRLLLDWDGIRRLSRSALVTIGSHTVNHYELSRLAPDEVRNEILRCRAAIESQIGRTVDHFAYPFGCRPVVGRREFEIAKTCLFKTCASTYHGYIHRGHGNSLERLPRVVVDERSTHASLDVRFNGAIDRAIRRIGGRPG